MKRKRSSNIIYLTVFFAISSSFILQPAGKHRRREIPSKKALIERYKTRQLKKTMEEEATKEYYTKTEMNKVKKKQEKKQKKYEKARKKFLNDPSKKTKEKLEKRKKKLDGYSEKLANKEKEFTQARESRKKTEKTYADYYYKNFSMSGNKEDAEKSAKHIVERKKAPWKQLKQINQYFLEKKILLKTRKKKKKEKKLPSKRKTKNLVKK
jgi:hypothetical protein